MRQVRGNEPVIRLGGDEFLVVLGGASAEQVERVARRVQLLALRGAPGPLSLGWAARERGESLPAVVARASGQRVPVPVGEGVQHRRAGEDTASRPGAPAHAVAASR
jgi:GGDEF domain-containing protein